MAVPFAGVFPVHNNTFEVEVSKDNWAEIANMETFSPQFDATVEEWYAFEGKGWANALKTGMKWSLSMNAKRTVGDAGNDFIANKKFAMGQDAYANFRWTLPTGTQITQQMVVNVKNDGGGDTTNVGKLEFDLQSNGKPTVTEPSGG